MVEFQSFVRDASTVKARGPRHLSQSRPVWVYGSGGFGKALAAALIARKFPVAGFVETTPRNAEAMGLPIKALSDAGAAHAKDQLAIGIYNPDAPFASLRDAAAKSGFSDIFLPYDFYGQFAKELGWRYWLSAPEAITDRQAEIEKTFHLLADEKSKEVYLGILKFRLGLDIDYCRVFDGEDQYFSDLTLPAISKGPISYVDGGAYDGDSYLHLLTKADVAEAYLFEPDVENYAKLVKNIQHAPGAVQCLPLAISDRYEIMTFSGGTGTSSAVVAGGDTSIAAIKLDDLFHNKIINMIKMDIEGSELAALRGARALIERSRPVLALSLYHKVDDLWAIPLEVSTMLPDHKLYIRQHMTNSFESVLYAVPG